MNDSAPCSDLHSPPAAKIRRLDKTRESKDDEKISVTTVDHSSRLVVNTFLNNIANADRLLLVSLYVENMKSFLSDSRQNCRVLANDHSAMQFVNTFLRLDGCAIVLRALRRWVKDGTNEHDMIDEETSAFVSTTLGFLLHLMMYDRRTTTSCIFDVKGLHITHVLMEICQKVPFDTVVLAQAISLWASLMMNVTRRSDALVENFSSLILNIMLLHPQRERIQRNGCKFFALLASMAPASRETQNFDRNKLQLLIQQSLAQDRLQERTLHWVRQCASLYASVRHVVSDGDDNARHVVSDGDDNAQ